MDLNDKIPVDTNYIRTYASVLQDDSVPQVENIKDTNRTFTFDTSHLKGKSWADDDSDSDDDETSLGEDKKQYFSSFEQSHTVRKLLLKTHPQCYLRATARACPMATLSI